MCPGRILFGSATLSESCVRVCELRSRGLCSERTLSGSATLGERNCVRVCDLRSRRLFLETILSRSAHLSVGIVSRWDLSGSGNLGERHCARGRFCPVLIVKLKGIVSGADCVRVCEFQ